MRPASLLTLSLSMYLLQAGAMSLAYSYRGYELARMFPPFRLPVFVMGCCAAFERLHRAHAHPLYSASFVHTAPPSLPQCVSLLADWSTASTAYCLLWFVLLGAAIAGDLALAGSDGGEPWTEFFRLSASHQTLAFRATLADALRVSPRPHRPGGADADPVLPTAA